MTRLVHWQEGMFMRVQSLQMLQQGLLERTEALRQMQQHYPYGVLEIDWDRAALEAGKISFTRLRVVLRTGLEVIVPEQCELASFPVREELGRSRTGELTILLGVPDHGLDHPNAFQARARADLQAKYRYLVQDEDRPDENTGDNRQPVLVRTLNGRLLFEHQDRSGLECLPLLRVRRAGMGAGTEFRVEVIPTVAPPCRLLSAWPPMAEMVRLAVQRVETSRRSLARSLRAQKFSLDALHGIQVVKLVRLLALSRHGARLATLLRSPHTTPFEAFQALYEILCELEVLRPRMDLTTDRALAYDHDDIYPVMSRLCDRLEQALRDTGEVNYLAVQFVAQPQQPDQVRAAITPEFFGANVTAYYLAVKTQLAVGDLTNTLQDRMRFELTVPSRLGQAFGGLQLRHEPDPPAGFPDAPDLYYFRIEQSAHASLWDKVQAEKELGINRRNPHLSLINAAFTLYATLEPRAPEADDAD
jgi:type VI secretion system protein ImpJ